MTTATITRTFSQSPRQLKRRAARAEAKQTKFAALISLFFPKTPGAGVYSGYCRNRNHKKCSGKVKDLFCVCQCHDN